MIVFYIVDVLYFWNLPIQLLPYTTYVLCKTFLPKFGIGVSRKNCTVGKSSVVAVYSVGLGKHSDRYDGAVLFMDLWTITAVLKSIVVVKH